MLRLSALLIVALSGPVFADNAASIAKKLDDAKAVNARAVENATLVLDRALEKKLEFAKRKGDLNLVQRVTSEQDAFSDRGVVPKSVRTTSYSAALRRANSTLIVAYKTAIKAYVQADLTDDAADINKELKDFMESAAATNSVWISLFDGKDVSKWAKAGNPAAKWRVENGVLVGSTRVPSSILYTGRKGLTDFHLRVETMLSQGSSGGVFFRWTPERGGLMAQVGGTNAGEFHKTGDLVATPGLQKPGRILIDAPVIQVEPDQWFSLEVKCNRAFVEITIDGKVVAKSSNVPWVQPGVIGLQCRGDSKVRFRKVEIKPL